MRSLWVWALTAVGVGGLVAGCALITGSTDGYTAIDAGEDAGCHSAAQCDQTGDAAEVCCLGLTGATCQANACFLSVQLCETTEECKTGSCVAQQCPGTTPSFSACGLFPGCSAIDAGTDAGNVDAGASVIDAGTDAGNRDAGASVADGG